MTNLFSGLSKFYLTNDNITTIYNNSFFCDNTNHFQKKEITNKKPIKKNTDNNLYIKEKDKLFWYLFIFENGFDAYHLLGRNKYSKEMDEKVEYIKYLKNEKRLLKDLKLKFSEIQENILYSPMNIFSLLAITSIKKINLIYYTDSLYYINNKYDKTPLIIYYDKENKKYNKVNNIDETELKKNRLNIQYIQKPIKGLSSYKVADLEEMCKVLNINTMKNATKKLKKKEIYEKIVLKIS